VNSAFYDAGCHGRLRRRRALAGLLVFVLCVLVMAAVVIVVVVASGQAERVLSTAPGALAPVYFGLVSVPVIIAPGALLAGRVGLRQSPAELVSNRRRFRPRLQLAAAAVGLAVGTAGTAAGVVVSGPLVESAPLGTSAGIAILALLLLVPVQTFAEELAFRSVLVKLLVAVLPSSSGGRFPVHLWVASVLSAALFAAIHGAIGGWLFAGHLVAALVWTWAASRLGGIEAGAGAHAAGNLLLLTLLVTGVTLPASHGPAAFATLLLTDATTIAIVLLLARRLPRLTG